MAAGAGEAQAGANHAGAGHNAALDHIADLQAAAADLTNGGQAVLQALVSLLNGNHGLLDGILQNPVGVVVGQVAGEVQMGIDQAGHDGLAGDVAGLVIGAVLLLGAGVNDLLVLYQNQRVLDRLGAGAVDQQTANKCYLTHNETNLLFPMFVYVPKRVLCAYRFTGKITFSWLPW